MKKSKLWMIVLVLVIVSIPVGIMYSSYRDRVKRVSFRNDINNIEKELMPVFKDLSQKGMVNTGTYSDLKSKFKSIEYFKITKNGNVIIYLDKYDSLVVLQPRINPEGKPEWLCMAAPRFIAGLSGCDGLLLGGEEKWDYLEIKQ